MTKTPRWPYALDAAGGFLSSNEFFVHVTDSMFNQQAKWLSICNHLSWRCKIQRRCSGSAHFSNAFWGRLRPDCEHDSPVDLPTLEALENIVDRFERLRLDDCHHLAFSSKTQSLFQIDPRAHNRAPDGIAVQY